MPNSTSASLWISKIDSVDPYGDIGELVDFILSCPASLRKTFDFGHLCGMAVGRIAEVIASGRSVNIRDKQLSELNNIITAQVEF